MNSPARFETKSAVITGGSRDWGMWERIVPTELKGDRASQAILKIHLNRYEAAAKYAVGKNVLDIACGCGFGSQMLKNLGAASVVGVDLSPSTLEFARKNYAAEGVQYVEGDAEKFSWPTKFDVVASYETLEHLPHPEQFLARVHEVLAPGGTFMLSVPLGETRHLDSFHLQVFEKEDIFRLFDQAGFTILKFRIDPFKLSSFEMWRWNRMYPESRAPIPDLLFTQRGRMLLKAFFTGGFDMPQILVAATHKTPENAGRTPEPLV